MLPQDYILIWKDSTGAPSDTCSLAIVNLSTSMIFMGMSVMKNYYVIHDIENDKLGIAPLKGSAKSNLIYDPYTPPSGGTSGGTTADTTGGTSGETSGEISGGTSGGTSGGISGGTLSGTTSETTGSTMSGTSSGTTNNGSTTNTLPLWEIITISVCTVVGVAIIVTVVCVVELKPVPLPKIKSLHKVIV